MFRITIDEIEQAIDELKPTVAALGYNKQTPGPTIRVNEGAKVRAIFTNNLKEATGVHFHGVEFDDFFMDGVPFVTQKPFAPGESFTYEFTANRPGSMMYHSHHNATDQVGPRPARRVHRRPDEADAGRHVRPRVHLDLERRPGRVHDQRPRLPGGRADPRGRRRDRADPVHERGDHVPPVPQPRLRADRSWRGTAYPLGPNAYGADTVTVGPGERWDVNMTAERPGLWAFHCHILPHVEGADGMFGMVNVLIVVPKTADVDTIVAALAAPSRTA